MVLAFLSRHTLLVLFPTALLNKFVLPPLTKLPWYAFAADKVFPYRTVDIGKDALLGHVQ